jgi:hypothetical protein
LLSLSQPRRAPRRVGAKHWLALLCVLPCAGCAKRLSAFECDQLLDRYVELLVESDRSDATPDELVHLKELARERAVPEFSACPERVSRRAFDCAMSAPDADRLEQCLL